MAGRGTPALQALTRAGVAYDAHDYTADPAAPSYAEGAAAALGIEAGRMFKSLVVSVAGRLCVCVVPATATLDLKAVGKGAAMAEPAAAERATGYVTGGISPLGHRTRLRVLVDASASSWDLVYVSGGRRGLSVSLAPDDLVRVASAEVLALTR